MEHNWIVWVGGGGQYDMLSLGPKFPVVPQPRDFQRRPSNHRHRILALLATHCLSYITCMLDDFFSELVTIILRSNLFWHCPTAKLLSLVYRGPRICSHSTFSSHILAFPRHFILRRLIFQHRYPGDFYSSKMGG